jgi:alpha-L-fucosidase 2
MNNSRRFAAAVTILSFCFSAYSARVGCVGTSITHWSGFPEKLGPLLGAGNTVYNLGKYGTTAIKAGDSPYLGCDRFPMVFSDLPELITIEMGINDSKNGNWNPARFDADLKSMIDTFSTMSTKPKIWLCLPSPVWNNVLGVSNDSVEQLVVPAILAIAAERGLPVIDLRTPFKNHPEWFGDGVHPLATSPVADSMAGIIRRAITQPVMGLSQQTVEFSAMIGQAGPADQTITVTNMGINTTLNQVSVTKHAAWLSVSINATNRNSQILTNHIDPSQVAAQERTWVDTVTVASSNANQTIRYIVTLWVRPAAVLSAVSITPASVHVPNQATQQFSAQGIDQYGKPMMPSPAITWSAGGGAITASGLYTAGTVQGSFPVIAAANAFSDTAYVNLSPITYLPEGRITKMLVLMQNGSPYIAKGSGTISTDFLGNEATVQPVAGAKDTVNGLECVWTLATDADGMWFDQTSQENFVAYGAIYIYSSDSLKKVYLRYRFDDNCRAYCNGTPRINETGLNDDGVQRVSSPMYLSRGINRFIFKFIENTGANYFGVRITDATGADATDVGYQFTPVPPTVNAIDAVASIHPANPAICLTNRAVRVTFPSREDRTIELIDAEGRLLYAQRQNASRIVLPISGYAAGIYILRAVSGHAAFTRVLAIR